MLLIVGIALGIGADRAYLRFDRLMERASYYRSQANIHNRSLRNIKAYLENGSIEPVDWPSVAVMVIGDRSGVESLRELREESKSLADHAEYLRSQCVVAAYLPFLPMPEDIEPSPYYGREVPPPPLEPLPSAPSEPENPASPRQDDGDGAGF
jgi:hypothetical protein